MEKTKRGDKTRANFQKTKNVIHVKNLRGRSATESSMENVTNQFFGWKLQKVKWWLLFSNMLNEIIFKCIISGFFFYYILLDDKIKVIVIVLVFFEKLTDSEIKFRLRV